MMKLEGADVKKELVVSERIIGEKDGLNEEGLGRGA